MKKLQRFRAFFFVTRRAEPPLTCVIPKKLPLRRPYISFTPKTMLRVHLNLHTDTDNNRHNLPTQIPPKNCNQKKSNLTLSDHIRALHPLWLLAISGINGALYFTIAQSGGENLQKIFDHTTSWGSYDTSLITAMASVSYMMFFYKTLESINLNATTRSQKTLVGLAPFAASAFLTGGIEGSLLLGFTTPTAMTIGMTLFVLRIVNCIDGSVKFPERLLEMRGNWQNAWQLRDKKELARLIITLLMSIGYSISVTDPIYAASQTIAGWLLINPSVAIPYSYMTSILGAIGTLPMTLYWTHRGLKQLTFGGTSDVNGNHPDPTDRYTYVALILVLPVTLGILGAASTHSGQVFAQCGVFAEFTRITTSLIYGTCAATPGMSTLLRNSMHYVKNNLLFKNKKIPPEKNEIQLSKKI